MKHILDFYTEYNQFYISSDGGKSVINHPKNLFDSNSRLIELKNMLIVCSESYGHIKGEFHELNEERKNIDWNKYDFIEEGGIQVISGIIQILDCPNSTVEFEINIKSGAYMIRAYISNMTGYDTGEDEGSEYYTIEIWPSAKMEKNILKAAYNN